MPNVAAEALQTSDSDMHLSSRSICMMLPDDERRWMVISSRPTLGVQQFNVLSHVVAVECAGRQNNETANQHTTVL